jgi:hypothetical protein
MPANGALAEEEEDPARALTGVDITGVVPIAIPDKVCLPRAPRVVEVVVESPCNIVDDPLHSLLVLHRRSVQEPTNVADGECQVRSCVGEVAKAPHKMSVLHSTHLLSLLPRLSFSVSSIGVRVGLQSVSPASSKMHLA